MRILLIGCGFHGRGIAYQLANTGGNHELLVADLNKESAARVALKTGAKCLQLDVTNPIRLREALEDIDLVFNATGPYHMLALGVIDAAIDTSTHYVDMNDDHEIAEAIFLDPTWDARARKAGIAIISGCGIMPGLSGMLARLGYEQIDKPEQINIWFSWNYSLQYPAAIQHFLHINSGQGLQFIDGKYIRPGPFSFEEKAQFLKPVSSGWVYYTGVPDPISISCSLPGLRIVTAKGGFHQTKANKFLKDMVGWGLTSYKEVSGAEISPMAFLMRYLNSPQGQRYFHIKPTDIPMAVRVQIKGLHNSKPYSLTYEAHDHSRKGTTSVAALVTLMLANGALDKRGTGSPEGWVQAIPFLKLLLREPEIMVFKINKDGTPERLEANT